MAKFLHSRFDRESLLVKMIALASGTESVKLRSDAGLRRARGRLAALLLASTCLAGAARAQVSWDGSSSVNWNDAANWTPAAIPVAGETTLFNGATPKTITVAGTAVNIAAIQFDPHAAPGYVLNITTAFTLTGAGIVNNSSNFPAFNLTTSTGVMELQGSATAGNAIFDISANGRLRFINTTTAANSQIIVDNLGELRLLNTATGGNSTIAVNNGGMVVLQDTATLGSSTVTINNGGTVALAGTSTGGDARLVINGGGTLDFTGLLGAATPSAGSIEGAGTICLCNHAFTVGSNNLSTVFSGTIQNGAPFGTPSQLVKVGTGKLTLAAGGTYGHTGATTVNGGTLEVNGSITTSSLLTVNNGGTVGGTGQLPSTIVNNGGTIAPGNSIGTITINGSLTFVGAGNYLLEVSPTAADLINVTGTATLSGAVTAVFQSGTYVTRSYVILSATGGVTGTFGSISGNLPGFNLALSYTSNDVLLSLTAQLGSTTGLTTNQRNVATAIDTFFNRGGALRPEFLGLFGLTGTSLRGALDQLSGEIGTGFASFESMRRFTSAMLNPWARADNGLRGPALGFAAEPAHALPEAVLAFERMPAKAKAPAPFEERWSAWAAAYGSKTKLPGEGAGIGSHSLDIRTGGIASGFDYRVSPGTVLGVSFAGGAESMGLSNGIGSAKTDVLQAGLYGSTVFNEHYLSAAAVLARFGVSTERTVTLPGVSERLLADYTAYGLSVRLETGRRFQVIDSLGLVPYAAIQLQRVRSPAYAERGAVPGAAFALTFDAYTAISTRSELGLTLDGRFDSFIGRPLSVFWRAAWGHEFHPDTSISATFQSLPGARFTVHGAASWRDAALISSGFDWQLTERVSLLGKLESEIARGASTVAGTGKLRVSW